MSTGSTGPGQERRHREWAPGALVLPKREVIEMFMVQVLYHPSNPDAFEAEYPAHVTRATPLILSLIHI